ncbi:MAG: M43 family zinc metalloprotease, partial [Flavobacteriales bacterium]|nr:M43 family zinc metalloprotease [Flavobacteriales bacterium]
MARFFVPFACLLLGASFATLSAQVTRCSADAHLEAQIASDTVFARSFFALEAALENMASTGFRSTEVHTLPVVVHIMHAGDAVGSGANISDAQVASAIEALNADFAGEFGGAAVDVEFALAVRDPSGNPTTGINRVNAAAIIPEFASDGMVTNNNMAASSEVNVKTLSHWPGEDYVNIWVVSKLNGGTSPIGFAYLPPTSGVVDGIVVHHKVFGVGEEYDLMNNYDLNRTLTHEVGHYLSLYHTFHQTTGCSDESNCSAQGDRVCDTPPTSGSVNCSALECEGTMVENFMDYSNDPC